MMPCRLNAQGPRTKASPWGKAPQNHHPHSLGEDYRIQWMDAEACPRGGSISSEEGVTTCPDSAPRQRGAGPRRNTSRQGIWSAAEVTSELRAMPCGEELATLVQADDVATVALHDHAGDTGVLLAAWFDKYHLLEILLTQTGVSVDVADTQGRTPLHLACYSGAAECCHLLLKHGASVHQWDKQRRATPLQCAASAGNLQCLRDLLKHGADVNVGLTVRSSLHYAVQSDAVDCVRELLASGACPNTPQVFTETPLHVAASLGSAPCVRLLLDHGADVRVQFGPGRVTPLHLAAEDGNAECARLLLDASAETDAVNGRRQTPLHLAALSQSAETTELLLSRGADVNSADADGRTPLHGAIVKVSRSCECVRLLLDSGAAVNRPDAFGYTPLHIAALNEFSNCVYLLLTYGGDVTARTKGGASVLSFIVRRTPDVLPRFVANLDASVRLHDHEIGDVDCELKLDFRILVPSVERGESELLLAFVEVGQRQVLKHPLCETFLFLKWRRIRKFFLFSLAFHTVFVLLFSTYVIGMFLKDCPRTAGDSQQNATTSEMPDNDCRLPAITSIAGYLLFTLNFILLAKEIFQMCHGWSVYIFYWENWLQWLIIISTFLCVVHPYGVRNIRSDVPMWQHHVAAVGIFLAWLELMMLVGRFPMFGLYVQMFTTVAVNFAKFLLAYSCLLIAFGLSFGVLFSNYKSFKNVAWGIMKTVVMMSGELEFESIFYPDDEDDPILYPVTAHLIFLAFVLLITVILTNLMVGLAVSDIQGLQQSAGLDRLVRQAQLVARLESMLFSRLLLWLPSKLLAVCQRSALLLTSSYHWTLYLRPNDPRESRVPRDLVKGAFRLVAERKEKPRHHGKYGSKFSRNGGLMGSSNTQTNNLWGSTRDYAGYSQNAGTGQKMNDVFTQLSALLSESTEREVMLQEKLHQLAAQVHSLQDELNQNEVNSGMF